MTDTEWKKYLDSQMASWLRYKKQDCRGARILNDTLAFIKEHEDYGPVEIATAILSSYAIGASLVLAKNLREVGKGEIALSIEKLARGKSDVINAATTSD